MASCRAGVVPRVDYRRPDAVSLPIGASIIDARFEFADTFCATLVHLDPSHATWGDCQEYIEARGTKQSVAADPLPNTLRVLVIGGIFSHCFEQRGISLFSDAQGHLTSKEHALIVTPLRVGGVDSPAANAAVIDKFLREHPGDYIAVGHSKGAVDLMTAIHLYQSAQDSIKALVSVAGAISGSRLIDFGEAATVVGFRSAARASGLGNCEIRENGGIASLRRDVRARFLKEWAPPATLKTYSIVGVADREHTSRPLHVMRDLLALYSQDQDSQMIADEAVIPGARYLGAAKGDHWAVALPLSNHPDPEIRRRVNRNRYPRVALLEAIIRFVHQTR
jgi:hypothetical protein